jgi:hypothetical protein
VPALLSCQSVDEGLSTVEALDPTHFDLFRLILVHRNRVAVVSSDGAAFAFERPNPSQPLMWTSSSRGESAVDQPRRVLFEEIVISAKADWLGAQERFHRHQWPSRTGISIRMERRDARTVSRTVIDVTPRAVSLSYQPLGTESDLGLFASTVVATRLKKSKSESEAA